VNETQPITDHSSRITLEPPS